MQFLFGILIAFAPPGMLGNLANLALYCLPELEGTKDYSTQVDPDILGICRNRCLFNQNNPGDTDMLHLFKLLMEENELSSPGNVDEACGLYQTLRHLATYEIYNL